MPGKKNKSEKSGFGRNFHKSMQIERELKQRDLKFSENVKEQKDLQEFLDEHQRFFEVYLENCISFHSKLPVRNLFEDMMTFLEDFVNMKHRVNLQKKLNCIDIEYECSDQLLYLFNFDHLKDNYGSRNFVEDINNYSLSKDLSNLHEEYSCVCFVHLLEKHQWIVILSDPGNSKTTILRWIIHKFDRAVKNNCRIVRFEADNCSAINIPVHISILIRIVEFVTWFEEDPIKTLIDYIGEHT
ncbi:unnamed protein product [Adineta ricciae]|uniref:Uncharacterized protein n=1 Tax=Adineta ricciae TaxID=249248 RepID=A0A815J4V9_ADIRI|nr:unnamed protein product [Adineta ricciae]CAF1374400.1 unnamed protein product [Adineta ricciae]